MKNINVQKRRKGQKGFTLVELAVVMIIVGLLIGGILKGQELITNAQVASVITQVRGLDAGVSTFRDSYRAVPGDMRTATARVPNCDAANNCVNGSGNGIVDVIAGGAGGNESALFFKHMALADVIGGIDPSAAIGTNIGVSYPETSLGGGLIVGHTNPTGGGTVPAVFGADIVAGHYVTLNSTVAAAANNTGPLTSQQAARIDRKMDDGAPQTGSVRSNLGTCAAAAAPAATPPVVGGYNEGTGGAACALMFRVQG